MNKAIVLDLIKLQEERAAQIERSLEEAVCAMTELRNAQAALVASLKKAREALEAHLPSEQS